MKAEIGFSKDDLDTWTTVSLDQMNEYVEAERRIYSGRQKEANLKFANEKMPFVFERESTFVSKYAPLVHTELSKTEIEELLENKAVSFVYYAPARELIESGSVAEQTVQTNLTKQLGLTGSGIKVGLLEAYGFPNTTYFSNAICEPGLTNTNDAHATNVAFLLCGEQTYISGQQVEGVVPDAELYCTYIGGAGLYVPRAEWLLDRGVVVINMSFVFEFDSFAGVYSNIDRWFDHIAINHSVHCVAAASNTNGTHYDDTNYQGYVLSPAMACNVITVGAIDDKGTVTKNDDTLALWGTHGSAYLQQSGYPNKPDICAPGTNLIIPNTSISASGTSYAAPLVAGVVAQLCQHSPYLIAKQACVKAIMCASTSHPLACTTDSTNWDKLGAGVVDALGSYNTAAVSRYVATNFQPSVPEGTVRTYSITATPSDTKLRVALTWLINNSYPSSNHSGTMYDGVMADLDLVVKDSRGNIMARARSPHNNLEVVQFATNGVAETYTVYVSLESAAYDANGNPDIIYYGLSWW